MHLCVFRSQPTVWKLLILFSCEFLDNENILNFQNVAAGNFVGHLPSSICLLCCCIWENRRFATSDFSVPSQPSHSKTNAHHVRWLSKLWASH